MIKIEQLLTEDSELRQFAAQPEMDPLTEADALQEAQLIAVRFDALTMTASLLFELRVALQMREANTGVLIARGVSKFIWSAAPRDRRYTAWNVIESLPQPVNGLFTVGLRLWPQGQLNLTSESATFFSGDVSCLECIPDYGTDDDATIQRNIANWESPFKPVYAVFLDPAPTV